MPPTTITILNSGSGAYTIDGVTNGDISLIRGRTYSLVINATGHPFWIQTVPGGYSSNNIYSSGVTNNGYQNGTITFVVPINAPDTLYYACEYHSSMQGRILITDLENQGISIHWNGSLFVLTHINNDGTSSYKYSIDGYTWENANVPENILIANHPTNIKRVGDQIVILGNLVTSSGNVRLTSTDGIHYGLSRPDTSKQIVDIETNAEFRNTIRFPPYVLLALGSNNTIAYSLDEGVSWSHSPSTYSTGVFSRVVNDARWNGRIWVSVGSGNTNTIATSVDGISWTGRGMTVFSEEATGVDWAKETNVWVATGIDSSLNRYSTAYSVDGIHWIGQSVPGITSGESVRWNGDIWVFVGVSATGTNTSIAYSLDGKQWNPVPNTFSVKASRVQWNVETGWVVFGEDPSWNVAISANGVDWTLRYDDSIQPVNTLEHSLYDGTMYWKSNNGNTYSKSVDGVYWESYSTITDMSMNTVRRFVRNTPNEAFATIQPLSIATGEGHNTLAYSYDGMYWTGLGKHIFTERGNRAVWNGKVWVAVGKGQYWVATSYDGIEWQGRESSIMTEGYDVAWNGSRFVAVGKGNNVMIATSTDGIFWDAISNSATIFTDYASNVCWTGKIWLAYGSGTNTTAISIDGITWTPTLDRNATIMDASSVFWSAGYMTGSTTPSGYNATSSTEQTGYEAFRLFDNIDNTGWKSANNTYSGGIYSGAQTTTYTPFGGETTQTASGEWISLSIPSAKTIRYYSVMFDTTLDTTSAIPRQWILLGSNDGSIWTEIHSFQFQTNTPPNNTWKFARFILPINIYSNSSTYSHYRLVIIGTFGASFASIMNVDLYMETNYSSTLSRYVSPIVLKNNILFLAGIVSSLPNGGVAYRFADLSANTLESRSMNGQQYVNSSIYGLSNRIITSTCFDGEYTYLTDVSGVVVILTNEASNTHLNFDISLNGGPAIDSRLTTIYSSCWNRHFVLFAGIGGISYGKPDDGNQWNLTNANDLFDAVYGVASNPGYGFVYVPNALYFRPNELLKVVGPKAQPFTGETDIHLNLYNSNKR